MDPLTDSTDAAPAAQPATPGAMPPPALDGEATPQVTAAAPQQQNPAAPTSTTPASPAPDQGGIAGVMGSVLDLLSNRDRTTMSRDNNGNMVTTPAAPLTRGQQIAQLAFTALRGATTAAAAKPGPGHMAAGVSAAVGQAVDDQQAAAHAKQEGADHDFAVKQKAKLDNLNYQLLTRQNTAAYMELQAKGVKATQDAIDFAGKVEDRENALGSYDLGTFADEREIPSVMAKQPQFMQKLYKEQGIIKAPVYNTDGTIAGVHIFERKPNVNAAMAPDGTVAHRFTLGSKPGEQPTMQTFTPTGASNADIDRYNLTAEKQMQDWQKAQADTAKTAADTREANANADAKPQETRAKVMEAGARVTEANASATNSYASAARTRQDMANQATSTGSGEDDDSLVKGVLNRTADIRSIVSLRKDGRERIYRKVLAADPNFNEKQYEGAMDTVKDFASDTGKANKAVVSMNKYMGHADGLLTAFANLRNTGSPMLNTPINKIKGSVLGSTPLTDVQQYMEAAGNEHMNYMLGGRVPHDSDIKARDEGMNANMTPAQLEAAVKSDMRIQLTQMGAMNQRHLRTVGRPAYGIVDPATKEVLQKAGLEGYAQKELGDAYNDGPAAIPVNHPQQAAAAGVPAGARAGYQNGQIVGYQDATGWHPLGGK